MPIIGNPKRFAVEYELNEMHEGAWLFGKACFYVDGERVGDFDLGTSLRDLLFEIEQMVKDRRRRLSERFESMPAAEVVASLEGALFGGGGELNERLAAQEQWARHKITPNVDIFDKWRIYLIESDTKARLLYGTAGGDVLEFLLSPGECDRVLQQTCVAIGALYDAEKRTPTP